MTAGNFVCGQLYSQYLLWYLAHKGRREEGARRVRATPGSDAILRKMAGLQMCPGKTPPRGTCKQSLDWNDQRPCLRTVGAEALSRKENSRDGRGGSEVRCLEEGCWGQRIRPAGGMMPGHRGYGKDCLFFFFPREVGYIWRIFSPSSSIWTVVHVCTLACSLRPRKSGRESFPGRLLTSFLAQVHPFLSLPFFSSNIEGILESSHRIQSIDGLGLFKWWYNGGNSCGKYFDFSLAPNTSQ